MTTSVPPLRERRRQREAEYVEVDQSIYDGIDFEAADHTADELSEIEQAHGDEAMLAHVVGVSVEDARRFGGSDRPTAG